MNTEKKFILAVNREFGTGGRAIAMEAARRLGVKVLDKSYLACIGENFNMTAEEIERVKAKRHSWWDDVCRFYQSHDSQRLTPVAISEERVTSRAIYQAETQVLSDFAEHESCVIVGRSACHIFKDDRTAVKVFLTASLPFRLKRIMEKYGYDEATALAKIKAIDKARETYSLNFSGKSRYDVRDYDIAVRVDNLTFEQAVELLVSAVRFHQQNAH